MEELGRVLFALLIIYSILIIFTILLLEKLCRSSLVRGVKTKETFKSGNFNFVTMDSNDHVISYFSFKTKNGKSISRRTSLFPMTREGKRRFFFYNEDKNEITAQIYTIVWQSFFFSSSLLFSAIVGLPFFIIAILIVITIVLVYYKKYKKKYLKEIK